MTIRIKKNTIEFVEDSSGNTYTLSENSNGFAFSGKITAGRFKILYSNSFGSNFGYASSGRIPSGTVNPIEKYSFSTDSNATDVGDVNFQRGYCSGNSSEVSGYVCGGGYTPFGPGAVNNIEKFPFATDSNGTDTQDLSTAAFFLAGNDSTTHGYQTGQNVMNKYPFANNTNATDIGNQTQGRYRMAGQSSVSHGYNSGGPPALNTIDRFPFATDANATDVGDLISARYEATGQSSDSNGYITGGQAPTLGLSSTTTVQKFPFAAQTTSSVFSNSVPQPNTGPASGTSSNVSGYDAGGNLTTTSGSIQKFSFSSDGSGSTVGNLLTGSSRYGLAGQQY